MTDNGPDLSGDWDIDPGHSRIGFSAKHAMVANVRGAFNDVTGTLHVDFDDPEKSNAEIVLKVASIDSRNAQRDEHLRSADFFDVEKFPDITFRSTRIEEVGENALVVSGDLTIRDVTKPITIPIEFTGAQVDAFGVQRAGFEGTRRIDRREYGLEWNMALDQGGWLVSEKITLEFEISAIKRQAEAEGVA
ncbi:YceI family protein [Agromyces sp. GXS1127]|uniref:YceI family protein n=1 Tax=Agromyces sp. GXS1127 TaxID=3424181 RepID=UPI003D31ABF9